MPEPTTAAGRALLAQANLMHKRWPSTDGLIGKHDIAAIEREAADAALARAEEAVEALESLSGWVTWSEDLAPAAQQYVDREAVLAVIRGERTHA